MLCNFGSPPEKGRRKVTVTLASFQLGGVRFRVTGDLQSKRVGFAELWRTWDRGLKALLWA